VSESRLAAVERALEEARRERDEARADLGEACAYAKRVKAGATRIGLLAEGVVHGDTQSASVLGVALQQFITDEEITVPENERALAAERQLVEAREQSERLREALRRLTEWIEREQSAWPRARADEATELIDRYVMPVLQVRDE